MNFEFYMNRGFTYVTLGRELKVCHTGSMGATMAQVDEDLAKMGLPSIERLKKEYPKFKESGDPGYCYEIIFDRR